MTTLPQTTPLRLPRPPGSAVTVAPVVSLPGGAPVSHGMSANDVWRVIRGNLWLIATMLCVSLIAGYAANRLLERYAPKYTASGVVIIHAPTVYNFQTRTEEQLSDYPGLTVEQRTQAMLLRNDSLFTKVLQNPSSLIRSTKWYHSFESPVRHADGSVSVSFDLPAAKKSLSESFTAAPVDGSNLDSVAMTCADGRDARDIVLAIVNQHLDLQDQLITEREFEKQTMLNQARDNQKTHIGDLLKTLHAKSLELNIEGPGKSDKLMTRQTELERLVNQRIEMQDSLLASKTQLDSLMDQINHGQEPAFIEEKVNADQKVRDYQSQVDSLDLRIKTTYEDGSESPDHKKAEAVYNALSAKLEDAKSIARQNYRNTAVSQLQTQQTLGQQELEGLNKRIDAARDELSGLSNSMGEYNTLTDELVKAREEMSQTQAQLDALASQIQMTSHGIWWAEQPTIPEQPSFPRLPVTMTASVMLGLAIALGIAFLRELTDTSVRSPRDITRVGNLTLLGMVPHEDDDPQSQGVPLPLVIFQAPNSIMAEGFRQVRTRLQHAASLDTTRTILVTSPSPGDGKSVVAANLAAGLALNGRAILLVDANFRRPMLDKSFSVDNSIGLSDVLSNGIDRFESAVHRSPVPNLDIMPSGARPANATELLEGRVLLDFIDRALEEYDHIIFDSGPLLLVSETAALAPRVDGVVTVVRARTNSRGLLQRLRDNLRQLKAEHLGVVLNAVRSQGGGYYGSAIKTYYEYQNAG